MPKIVYTQEMIDFLRDRVDEMRFKMLTDAFNSHFNLHKTVSQVKSLCVYHKIYRKCLYTQEMINFLKEKIKELSFDELAKSFNKNFGTRKSRRTIQTACFRYGIRRDRFVFTEKMINFLKKNGKSNSRNELRIIFNSEFNLDISLNALSQACNSDDPAITEYQSKKLADGVNFEHLAIYVAWKFKHLLSPQMQKILEAQHPRPENV